jgi:hypothetical protein
MKRITKTRAILVAICLTLLGYGMAVAQSPLVGTPYMTDRPDGQRTIKFPTGTDTVYLVFDYDVGRDTEIIVEIREEQSEGAVIFTHREVYSGSGTATIEIKAPGGGAFRDGVYNTIIKFGPQRYLTAGWEWAVGDIPLEEPVSKAQPREPVQPPSAPVAESLNQMVVPTPAPVSATGGLPPVVLAVLGVVVLILLGVIVWAVRGFMTAT